MSRESTWIFWVQLLLSEALHTLRSVEEESAPKQIQSGTDMNKTNGRQYHTLVQWKGSECKLKKNPNPCLKNGSSYYLLNSWKFLNFKCDNMLYHSSFNFNQKDIPVPGTICICDTGDP